MSIIQTIKELFEKTSDKDIKCDCGKLLRFSDNGAFEITEDGLNKIEEGLFVSGDDKYLIKEGNLVEGLTFYDVFLKDGPSAHIITKVSGKMSEGDKLTIGGLEASPGEYVINDGRILFVKEGGVIEKIENKKYNMENSKRFSATKRIENADAMQIFDITIVGEELVEDSNVVVIDENLNVDDSYTGELEVEGVKVMIDSGVIKSIETSEEMSKEDKEDESSKNIELSEEENKEDVEDSKEKEEDKVELKITELFSKIEELEKVNLELSEKVSILLDEPSEEKTKVKLDFKKSDKDSKINFFKK